MLTLEVKAGTAVPQAADQDQRSLGTKIMRNVMFGGLRYVFIAPIPFVMTPLILHKIGVAGYGTWAIFLAINGLTSLTDLGLVGTLSKFVAEYYARKDFPALTRLLGSGLTLFLLLDLVLSMSVWLTSPLIAERFFRGSTVPGVELVTLLRCFLIVIAANILSQLFASVTSGLQRLDLTHMISAANAIMSALFGGMLLLRGNGLRGLVYGYVGSAILTIVIYLVLIRKLLPQVALNPFRFNKREARKMFGYSLRLYLTQAAVAVHNQVEKVLLALLVGVAAVGWYDIASDIALKMRGTVGLILSPVLPAASELSALGDESRTKELYYRSHKYLALVGVPVVCFVAAVSHRFVELWLGPNLTMIALPLSVLLAVNFFNLATGPGFLIFAGMGNLRPGMQSAVLAIALNVLLSLGLIYKFGFAGAVMGTAGALILASAYFMMLFHRETRYSFRRVVLESYLKPLLCSVSLLTLIVLVHPAKTLSWWGLAGMGILFGVIYSAVILQSGFFDFYDWSKVESFIPVARFARRLVRIA
ncbi:MAG: rane protein involved in the export of O-antigen and teichoic acid [Candidatus Sulfotelmatobacter sp.]|nr:rane protein involved in the export of O-antigen and teichoic acid [Candidatus Sulfotelmatobacter sp.]